MCDWKPDFDTLNKRVDGIESRLSQVEHDVGKMRSESQDGFRAINSSLANLAHDFGQRMNTLDARIVAEKEKWGATLRSIVTWAVRTILAGCAVAMGITAWRSLMGGAA